MKGCPSFGCMCCSRIGDRARLRNWGSRVAPCPVEGSTGHGLHVVVITDRSQGVTMCRGHVDKWAKWIATHAEADQTEGGSPMNPELRIAK